MRAKREADLVIYIGHNGLMDFSLPQVSAVASGSTDVMVLCCKSNVYFMPHLQALKAHPVLMTEQFMYPGAFLVRDTVPLWAKGVGVDKLREAAGAA